MKLNIQCDSVIHTVKRMEGERRVSQMDLSKDSEEHAMLRADCRVSWGDREVRSRINDYPLLLLKNNGIVKQSH